MAVRSGVLRWVAVRWVAVRSGEPRWVVVRWVVVRSAVLVSVVRQAPAAAESAGRTGRLRTRGWRAG